MKIKSDEYLRAIARQQRITVGEAEDLADAMAYFFGPDRASLLKPQDNQDRDNGEHGAGQ